MLRVVLRVLRLSTIFAGVALSISMLLVGLVKAGERQPSAAVHAGFIRDVTADCRLLT